MLGYCGPTRFSSQWTLLRCMRARHGLTQTELGTLVGATRATISSLERARSLPSVGLAVALARTFDLSVEELFGS
jgi:putative transcriptional regulator